MSILIDHAYEDTEARANALEPYVDDVHIAARIALRGVIADVDSAMEALTEVIQLEAEARYEAVCEQSRQDEAESLADAREERWST